jgi:hypothetical protein
MRQCDPFVGMTLADAAVMAPHRQRGLSLDDRLAGGRVCDSAQKS